MSLFLNLLFETDSYSNEYLLAKIGVDTAENEPLEVWGKIIQYYSFVSLVTTSFIDSAPSAIKINNSPISSAMITCPLALPFGPIISEKLLETRSRVRTPVNNFE